MEKMEKKFLADIKVGDVIYRLNEQTARQKGDVVEELTVDEIDIIDDFLVIKSGGETLINYLIDAIDSCDCVLDYCDYYGTTRESVVREFNKSIDSDIEQYESEIKCIKDEIEKLKLKKLQL